ncbi:ImmA/IrrE family metallo-endopeptidase [Halioxenophilus aromaticivorans]|uniref:ImmA/IrrE family metallo-endopeptidase n=1 Tax=Halioxenophilus aromaticivorans TaxID=1306992 RepID=A0AAV3UAG5_9ALTE
MNVAQKLARDVYSQYAGSLPVDPIMVARDMGCEVEPIDPFTSEFDREPNCSGMAYLDRGVKYIKYSASESPLRQRFTVAHELGHHLLGHVKKGMKFRDTPNEFRASVSSREEREANVFAAELLMPSELVMSAYLNSSIRDVEKLASAFGVSKVAMRIKLQELDLITSISIDRSGVRYPYNAG